MNNILVLYKSKYGATEKYAQMLQGLLDCDICQIDDCRGDSLGSYSAVIFAGGIYAGGIAGIRQFEKLCAGLGDRRLAVLCVGASPFDQKALEEVTARNLNTGFLKGIPLFYARGVWDEARMTFKDRTLCRMLLKMVAKKDPSACEPWMLDLLNASGQACDWTDEAYLQPLIEYMKM